MSGIGDDGLDLDPQGTPGRPVRVVRLDDWAGASPAEIARAAADTLATRALTVGIATRSPAPALVPLLEALSLTLGPADFLADFPADSPYVVPTHDPEQALTELLAAVAAHPQAAVALGQLLRQTAVLDVAPGLAAEAAVYSVLLGGTEFAAWRTATGSRPAAEPRDALVALDRTDDRLSVVLDHPERRNALSFAMREALYDALELALLDDSITRVALAGAGPTFCSGGDLAEFGTATDLVAAYLVRLDRAPWALLDRLRDRLGDQVRVDVQGAAVGAGAELAAFGGHVRCAPDAWFQLPEIAMGLVPGAGGTVSVTRRIGRWRTAWMVLAGVRVDAATALAWGLVDEITEPVRP